LHLAYAIDHIGGGGAQRQAVELAVFLAREPGVRVSLLAYHPADFFGPRLAGSPVQVVRISKRAKFDPSLPLRIARWLSGDAVDVLHAFMPTPAFWNLLAVRSLPGSRRPAFVVGDRSMGVTRTVLAGAAQRFVYRLADAVTVNAESAVDSIRARVGVPRERMHYVPNGIDLEAWDRALAASCPLELAPGLFHVALIGRFEAEKGHALVLEALSRLEPALRAGLRVWFVGAETGGSALPAALRAEIARRGLGEIVQLVPPVREVAAVLGRVDALVLASRYEGFPNVLLEAMASRKPSIATRVGDVPNMLEDGESGIVIDVGDAAALARALARLRRASPGERAAMGARARAAVEARYQLSSVAQRHLALYRALAEQRERAAPNRA
jgi:glycosyltransferase involved in cell wall biosynthesis